MFGGRGGGGGGVLKEIVGFRGHEGFENFRG